MNLCNNRCTKLSAIWFISYFLSTYCAVVVNTSNHSSKYQMGNRVNHRQLTITGTYQSDRLLQRIKDVCQRISTKLPVVFSNETDTNQWNYNQPSNSAGIFTQIWNPNIILTQFHNFSAQSFCRDTEYFPFLAVA